jgi:hypothetical protein
VIAERGRAGVGRNSKKNAAKDNHPALASAFDEEIQSDEHHGHDEVPLLAHERHQHVQEDMSEATVDQDEHRLIHSSNRFGDVVQYAVLPGALEGPL